VLGFGVVGWGAGVWGLGFGPQPPIPNPQSPIPNPQNFKYKLNKNIFDIILYKIYIKYKFIF
jgi:hypothetical protein